MRTRLFSPLGACLLAAFLGLQSSVGAVEVRVMTFNLWHGGDAGRQPFARTVEVIRASRADIVGLQETKGHQRDGRRPDHGARLAELLGWYYFSQGDSPGVLSRWPVVTNTPGRHGVTVRHPSGLELRLFNVHLPAAPYQPYQLLKIPYFNAPFVTTADEAVAEARKSRGRPLDRLLQELRSALASDEPVFLTGDFNEPSHLDWTERAARAGLCPLPVPYPTTLAVVNAGLSDAFRTVHADEVARPGWTWTPITRPDDPKDRHDRIDMIFFAGRGVSVVGCEIVGEAREVADLVVNPYPSDHRAVVATFKLEAPAR